MSCLLLTSTQQFILGTYAVYLHKANSINSEKYLSLFFRRSNSSDTELETPEEAPGNTSRDSESVDSEKPETEIPDSSESDSLKPEASESLVPEKPESQFSPSENIDQSIRYLAW